MPRDPSGNVTSPLPPVAPNDLIESSWANTMFADANAVMSDSLSRSGKGGMTAAFKIFDGTITAPGLAFTAEANSGLYRAIGGSDLRMSVVGNDIMRWTSANGAQIWTGAQFEDLIPEAPADGSYYTRIDNDWQVDPVPAANAAAISALDIRVTQNEADIATNVTDIGTNATNIGTNAAGIAQNASDISDLATATSEADISAVSWDGVILTLTRTDGNFVPNLRVKTELVSGSAVADAMIRHKLVEHNTGSGTESIDVSVANRHHISNAGAFQLDLTGLPGNDDDLGPNFQQEGQIIINNLVGADTITLGVAGTVIGEQTTTDSVAQILTYLIQRRGGVNNIYYVWSASA